MLPVRGVKVPQGGVPVEGEHDDTVVGGDATGGPRGDPAGGFRVVRRHHEVVQASRTGRAHQVCRWPRRGGGRTCFQPGRGHSQAGAKVAEHVLGFQVPFRGTTRSIAGRMEDHVEVAAHH